METPDFERMAMKVYASLGRGSTADTANLARAFRQVHAAALEGAARVAESHTWLCDVEWWLNATKKEVSEVSATEAAAAIRALATKEAR